jgi:hypothetical protein
MTAGALVLALYAASAATADGAEDLAIAEEAGPEGDEASAEEDAALVGAVAESESIGARLRRSRRARGGTTWWPRLALSLSWRRGGPARLDRAAGTSDALDLAGHEDLAWSIVATWGSP